MSEILEHYDLALISLYLFWVFFAALIIYLQRESNREGFPLVTDGPVQPRIPSVGLTGLPTPKVFKLLHGGTATSPNMKPDERNHAVRPAGNFPGAPLDPTGNPMIDGVGPASYALRDDGPELTLGGDIKIVPLRITNDFHLEERDLDPRGLPVRGADGGEAGIVRDVWVDRSEFVLRYLEVELTVGDGGRRVLVPMNFCTFDGTIVRHVRVRAINAAQFADIPATRHPEQVTRLEEDKITGYFGGGVLYANPGRSEPLL